MDQIRSTKYHNIRYLSGDDIYKNYRSSFSGCRNAREIIIKKKINKTDFIFIKETAKVKIKADGSDKKRHRVFITESWFNAYNNSVKKYPPAPEIIELTDNEKFYDSDGNILEIETRGKRESGKCFFLAKDTANAFGLNYNNLRDTVNDKNSSYTENLDYVYFDCSNQVNTPTNNLKQAKTLFFTYEGILRLLFVSRTSNMNSFRTWLRDVFFTIQMGDRNEREILATKIAGADIDQVTTVLNINSSSISCVYLFYIGKAADMRDSLNLSSNINDEDHIYKFGYTNNLTRRATEHMDEYGKLAGATIRLILFKTIDPTLISKAEAELHNYFKKSQCAVKHNKYKELVFLSKKRPNKQKKSQYDLTTDFYDQLEELYIGKLSNLRMTVLAVNNELLMAKERENTYKEKINVLEEKVNRIIAEHKLQIIKLQKKNAKN